MAFTHVYQPDVALSGWAALQAGLGEAAVRDREFNEGTRRFDTSLAAQLAEQQARQQLAQRGQALAEQEQQARLAMQQQQMVQQAYQFDRSAGQQDQQFGAKLGQDSYQFEATAFDRARAQQQQQQFEALQTGMRGDIDLRNRMIQGQSQYGVHDLDAQTRLQAELMRQSGLNGRSDLRAETQLEGARKTQIAKQLHDEWRSIQEHAKDMTPEQYQDVIGQFKEKAAMLGMEPPVDMPQPQRPGGYDPKETLQDMQTKYPTLPWTLYPDGSVGLPKGYNPANTPEALQSKLDHESQQKDKDNANKLETELRKQQQAREKETAAEQVKARNDYFKQVEAMRRQSLQKPADGQGLPSLNEDYFNKGVEWIRTQFRDQHGYEAPDVPAQPGQQPGTQLKTVSTPADYAALQPGEQYYDPQGNLRTKR